MSTFDGNTKQDQLPPPTPQPQGPPPGYQQQQQPQWAQPPIQQQPPVVGNVSNVFFTLKENRTALHDDEYSVIFISLN